MNVNDILKFIEQFGVRAVIKGDIVEFYNMDTDNLMTIYETKKQYHSLKDLRPGKFFIVHDKDKMLRLEFDCYRTNKGVFRDDMMLSRIQFGTNMEDHIADINVSPRATQLKLQSFYKKAPNEHDYDRTTITIEDPEYIYVDNNGKDGSYYDNELKLDNLSETEMLDVINNNQYFEKFMNYYGEYYPELKTSLAIFKENVGGIKL